MLTYCDEKLQGFLTPEEQRLQVPQWRLAEKLLDSRDGPGSDFLGWLDLPQTAGAELHRVQETAARLAGLSDVLVVIGIGGSYLGARAVIEALGPALRGLGNLKKDGHPLILYAGHHLSARELLALEELLDGCDWSLNVISKSGTTTEPAIAFRRLRAKLEKRYGQRGAAERIVATTDRERGALRTLADEQGYESFVVPDDVGGRYSVLSPVGLLPIAASGLDPQGLLTGAAEAQQAYLTEDFEKNDCARYAINRTILYRRGYAIELLVNYEPGFHMMAEWWKQLYGESEGKDGRGLYPAAVDNTTDLHSLGQYVQDGRRFLFETVLQIADGGSHLEIPLAEDDLDGLNYLAGADLEWVNERALLATQLAHVDGGVPNQTLRLQRRDERALGWLIFFFEKACALSGYMNAVNPFDQPGVEDYKKNMFALLGKPGFAARRAELEGNL